MATISCRVCSREIRADAPLCPDCASVAPMSDDRLVEIERMVSYQPMQEFLAEVGDDLAELIPELQRLGEIEVVVPELVAEVRRLRRALRLSEASRGVPVSMGRD